MADETLPQIGGEPEERSEGGDRVDLDRLYALADAMGEAGDLPSPGSEMRIMDLTRALMFKARIRASGWLYEFREDFDIQHRSLYVKVKSPQQDEPSEEILVFGAQDDWEFPIGNAFFYRLFQQIEMDALGAWQMALIRHWFILKALDLRVETIDEWPEDVAHQYDSLAHGQILANQTGRLDVIDGYLIRELNKYNQAACFYYGAKRQIQDSLRKEGYDLNDDIVSRVISGAINPDRAAARDKELYAKYERYLPGSAIQQAMIYHRPVREFEGWPRFHHLLEYIRKAFSQHLEWRGWGARKRRSHSYLEDEDIV